ncbi:MAG: hypothetical protein AB2A00_43445, partial [Myxococcota bacterium]
MRRALSTLLVVTAGCVNLPSESLVSDLRVLAVQAEPPEVLYRLLHLVSSDERSGANLGPYGISVKALVVDPQGRPVDVSVRLCPEQTTDECPDYTVRSDAPAEQGAAITSAITPVESSTRANVDTGGEVTIPDVAWSLPAAAVDYMVPRDAQGNPSSSALTYSVFPSVVVRAQVRNSDEHETGKKRFQLTANIDDTTAPASLRAQVLQIFRMNLGVSPCPTGTNPAADVACLKPRPQNHNPGIAKILYVEGTAGGGGGGPGLGGGGGFGGAGGVSDEEMTEVTGPISIQANSTYTFRPVVSPDSH